MTFLDLHFCQTSARPNIHLWLQYRELTFCQPQLSDCQLAIFDICIRGFTATEKVKMDAGSIFLICFVAIFGSLLIAGWRFGHPLLVRYARRRPSRAPPGQIPQTGSETMGGGQESAETSGEARTLNWASRENLVRGPSATFPSDDQPNPSSRASPVSTLSFTTSQTRSSGGSDEFPELDLVKEPHDLHNMAPIPPLPKESLSRRIAEIGAQVSLLLPMI